MASIPTPNDPLGRITQHSAHPLQSRIEQLKQLFPEAVQEGELDMNTLQNLLGKPSPQPDRYRFHWAGKQEAILSLHQPSTATLTPVPAESIQWDTTQHAFIEGDNLEVLKLLYKSYFGRVKLIYIDPPYNTGNDFIYPDDYTQPLEHY
ncbi:MAG: site-specific DNA-methyltransferase, partial [Phototrophicaceae bacterium]